MWYSNYVNRSYNIYKYLTMKPIIIKSLINANNTFVYPDEHEYSVSTDERNLYKIMNMHYSNVIRSIGDIGGHSETTNNNVIVCCTTGCDFQRPEKEAIDIRHNVIYTDKNYQMQRKYNKIISNFANFYGDIATVLKFLAPFKMLAHNGHFQLTPERYKHVVEDYFNVGRHDNHWNDCALKAPHAGIYNDLMFDGLYDLIDEG